MDVRAVQKEFPDREMGLVRRVAGVVLGSVLSRKSCLVCGAPLRQNGGVVKYCSRGKNGCRRKRTMFARMSAVDATAASLAMLGRRGR